MRQFLLTNLVEIEGGTYKWRVNLESLMNNFPAVVNFKPPQASYKGPVLFIGGSKSSYLRFGIINSLYTIFLSIYYSNFTKFVLSGQKIIKTY